MADIRFRKLISTETGVGATSGRETAAFFNENFEVTKRNLEAIWAILEMVVQSPNVEGVRIRPVLDPEDDSKILHTIFEYNLDGDLEDGEWFPIQVLFEQLVGDVQQNPQLKEALDALTPLTRFIPVESQVQTNTSTISQHGTRIENLEKTTTEHTKEIDDLQALTDQHSKDLRLKVNQVLESFDLVTKGSGYKEGTTVLDAAGTHVLNVESVDADGGIISVSISSEATADPFYINVKNGGSLYKVGDIIPTGTSGWNAEVAVVDVDGRIVEAKKTMDMPGTEVIGTGADLEVISGTGATINTTTYPTIHLQAVNDGKHDRLVFYLNGDLTNPFEFVAYPEFKNVQNIIDNGSTYYELWSNADSSVAVDYQIGDTFSIDGTTYTGQIIDMSTTPWTLSTDIPATAINDLKGTYLTTATSGIGSGLKINIGSVFHPQQTTNTEFNQYMDNYTQYVQDLIDASLAELESTLRRLINSKADQVDFVAHLNDFNNPHQVTKDQVGLGNVDNTSDLDKPISNAVQYQINSLNQKMNSEKHPLVCSLNYYNYLVESNLLDSSVIYFVGNQNRSWANSFELDQSGITSPYSDNEILYINGTEWQLIITDVTQNPMWVDTTISPVTEFSATGSYQTTSVNGSGEGLVVNITSREM